MAAGASIGKPLEILELRAQIQNDSAQTLRYGQVLRPDLLKTGRRQRLPLMVESFDQIESKAAMSRSNQNLLSFHQVHLAAFSTVIHIETLLGTCQWMARHSSSQTAF